MDIPAKSRLPADPSAPADRWRTRKFQRRPRLETARLAITERDLAVVRLVHEYRFLRSSHIVSLLELSGYSKQHTLRRLRRLYDGGFLDRPEEQWAFRLRAGSEPIVYALGDQGAALLEDHFGIPHARTRLRDRNREVGDRHVKHCLFVADIMLAFERTCRRRGNVRVIPAHEILSGAPDAVRAEPKPFQWQVKTLVEREPLRVPAVPDKVFGLEYTDRAGPNRLWFMLEADRGTETITPINLKSARRPTLFHKFLAYHATREQKLHTDRYGFRSFRVLTVTTAGAGRLASMREAVARATGGRDLSLYLFAARSHLLEHADVLSMKWQTASGETLELDI